MSLVAAYSDSESESDSEEDKNHSTPKADFKVVSSPNKEPHPGKNAISNDQPVSNHSMVEEEVETENDSPHFQIEDDDAWMGSVASDPVSAQQQPLFAALPQPKPKELDIVEEMEDEFMKKVDKFETVDEPLLEPIGSTSSMKEPSTSKKSSSLSLPPPAKKSSRKGPVKISIPSLDDIDPGSDSDEENSKHTRKTIPGCKTKSTLISMLPKPRHSVTVGCNKNKMFAPQANRPLIPHTLSKKPSTAPKPSKKTPVTQKSSGRKGVEGGVSDSDDDDEVGTGNFFSLGGQCSSVSSDGSTEISPNLSNVVLFDTVPSNPPKTCTSSSSSSASPSSSSSKSSTSKSSVPCQPKIDVKKPSSICKNATTKTTKTTSNTNLKHSVEKASLPSGKVDTSTKGNAFFANMYKSKEEVKKPPTVSSTSSQKQKQSSKTAPQSNVTGPYGDATGPYGAATGPYGAATGPYGDATGPYGDATGPYGDATGPYGSATGPYGSMTSPYAGSSSSSSTSQGPYVKGYPSFAPDFSANTYHSVDTHIGNMGNEDVAMNEDAIRQLQGSKRKHEQINIIDIQGPDVRGDREAILRNATTDMMAQQKKKNDEDAPTGQQKRKHQIQYLAHQAKEREFQLQQQWAESRATKQVTQARYGF